MEVIRLAIATIAGVQALAGVETMCVYRQVSKHACTYVCLKQRFPNCGPRTPGVPWGSEAFPREIIVFLQNLEIKMCKFFYTDCTQNYYCSYLSVPAVKQIIIYYAVILVIGSVENSVAFYLKSETDTYYFSLAIWNSITKEHPNNYASAIRHNLMYCGEWQNHRLLL